MHADDRKRPSALLEDGGEAFCGALTNLLFWRALPSSQDCGSQRGRVCNDCHSLLHVDHILLSESMIRSRFVLCLQCRLSIQELWSLTFACFLITLLVVTGRRASQLKAVVKNIDADDSADEQDDDDERSVRRFLISAATI